MKSKDRELFLTREAQSDITGILNYTLETWGAAQAAIYAGKFDEGLSLLLENPLLGRQRNDILPGDRVWRIERHFAIYSLQDERVSIIRVLHVSCDVEDHLES
jgi:toxin ParE1/3/4